MIIKVISSSSFEVGGKSYKKGMHDIDANELKTRQEVEGLRKIGVLAIVDRIEQKQESPKAEPKAKRKTRGKSKFST